MSTIESCYHDSQTYPPTETWIEHGGILLLVLAVFAMFWAFSYVCEEYCVPAVYLFCKRNNISEDVTGAIFVGAGLSAPSIFVSFVGLFATNSAISIGSVIGGNIFNNFANLAATIVAAPKDLALNKMVCIRELLMYILSLFVLLWTTKHNLGSSLTKMWEIQSWYQCLDITWVSSLVLTLCYGLYCIVEIYQVPIQKKVDKLVCRPKGKPDTTTEEPIPISADSAVLDSSKSESGVMFGGEKPLLSTTSNEDMREEKPIPLGGNADTGNSSNHADVPNRDGGYAKVPSTADIEALQNLEQSSIDQVEVESANPSLFVAKPSLIYLAAHSSELDTIENENQLSSQSFTPNQPILDTMAAGARESQRLVDTPSDEGDGKASEQTEHPTVTESLVSTSNVQLTFPSTSAGLATVTTILDANVASMEEGVVDLIAQVVSPESALEFSMAKRNEFYSRNASCLMSQARLWQERHFVLDELGLYYRVHKQDPSRGAHCRMINVFDLRAFSFIGEELRLELNSTKLYNFKINQQDLHKKPEIVTRLRKFRRISQELSRKECISLAENSKLVIGNGEQLISPDEDTAWQNVLIMPHGAFLRGLFVFTFPIRCLMYLTIPDVRNPKHSKRVLVSIFMSFSWVLIISYILIICLSMIGNMFQISPVVLGLTVAAWASSYPALWSSVVLARDELGDCAYCNAMGSSTFNNFLGLGLPWLVWSILHKGESYNILLDDGLAFSIVIMVLLAVLTFIVIVIGSWTLQRWMAGVFGLLYFISIALLCVLTGFRINTTATCGCTL